MFVALFLVYSSFYGTLSIYTPSGAIKALKEIFIVLLTTYVLLDFVRTKDKVIKEERYFIFVLLLSLMVIGAVGMLGNNSIISYVYGVKITLIPIASIFIGIYITKYNIDLVKIFAWIYTFIIIGWIIQDILGLETLMNLGFQYGVNVKNFNDELRLPSLVGTPDAYAFLLSILGIFLEVKMKNHKKMKLIIKITTLLFLVLATIRSALTLWLVFQIASYIQKISLEKTKRKYIYVSLICFSLAAIPLLWTFVLQGSELTGTHSLEDRFSHWFLNLAPIYTGQGIIGNGLGAVGSASKSLATLGFRSGSYVVDNQYFAIYEQVGIVGFFVMLLLLLIIIKSILANKYNNGIDILPLVIATLFSSCFTNILELYPFNIALFVIIGSSMSPYKTKSYFLSQKRFVKRGFK